MRFGKSRARALLVNLCGVMVGSIVAGAVFGRFPGHRGGVGCTSALTEGNTGGSSHIARLQVLHERHYGGARLFASSGFRTRLSHFLANPGPVRHRVLAWWVAPHLG